MAEKLIIEIDGDVEAIKQKLKDLGADVKGSFKGVDEVNKKLDGTKSRISQIGSGIKSAFSGLNKIGTGAVKAISAGIGAASAAIGGLSMAIYGATGNYEQLVGGVETLFGAGGKTLQEYAAEAGKTAGEVSGEYSKLMASQNEVLKNADNAYKTAGMSANQYIETVTSFSASLLQSVGGDTMKAAKAADQAITDMADNANRMGISMESIQNAYQGFAKQNYTMLDNLKLGYGGTKEEMQRLLRNAEAFSGVKYDISNLNDVYEAIHVVQTMMGTTGTTAKEASSTLQGSFASMKAAASNLLVAIGTGKGLDGAMKNLVASAKTFASNLLPMVKTAMQGLGLLAKEIAPLISSAIPGLVTDIFPQLLGAGVSMLTAIVQGLAQAAPTLSSAGLDILRQLIAGIQSVVAEILPMAGTIIRTLAEGFLTYQGAVLQLGLDIIVALIQGLAEALPALIPQAVALVQNLAGLILQNLPVIAAAGREILTALLTGIGEAIPVFQPLTDFLLGLVSNFESLSPAIVGVTTAVVAFKSAMAIQALIQGISSGLAAFKAANEGATLAQAAMNAVMAMNPFVLITAAVIGVVAALIYLWNTNEGFRAAVIRAWGLIKEKFNDVKTFFANIGTDIAAAVGGWWTAMKAKVEEIWENVKAVFKNLWDDLIGHSIVWDIINDVISAFSGWWDGLKGIVEGLINNIKEKFEEAKDAVVGFFKNIFGGEEEKDVAVNAEVGADGLMAVNAFEPVPQAVIDSYNLLNAALALVNAEVAKLNGYFGGAAAGESSLISGMTAASEFIAGTLTETMTAFATFLSATFLTALTGVRDAIYSAGGGSASILIGLTAVEVYTSGTLQPSLDGFAKFLEETLKPKIEGVRDILYVPGGSGNTLWNSMGKVKGLAEDIKAVFLQVIEVWKGSFGDAVEYVKKKSGELCGMLSKIERHGWGIEAAFIAAAAAVRDLISVMEDAPALPGRSGRSNYERHRNNARENAWGGWTSTRGLTLVGERGPELIGTSRMMNVWRNDEIIKRLAQARNVVTAMSSARFPRSGDSRILDQSTTNNNTNHLNFGNIYGEQYLKSFIERTIEQVVRKGVFLGSPG